MAEDNPRRGDSRSRPVSPSGGGNGAETGWAVTGTMFSGMVVWGGAGWLLDRWWDVKFLAPVGIILGMAVAIYLVVVRYGAVPPPSGGQHERRTTGSRPGNQGGPTRTQKGRP